MEHGEVVGGVAFPAHQQTTEAVVPAVGAFDDPAPRFALGAPNERLFAATSDVRNDPAFANSGFDVGVVISLVQTEVLRASRATRCPQWNSIEHLSHHPLVVHVRTCDQRGDRHAPTIRENVPFHAEFPPVRRVPPCIAPPLGAWAMAPSSEAKSHLMPRRLS